MECSVKANSARCNCTYSSCERRGRCCDCVAYHRKSNELPACFFSAEAEKTYNRSVEFFVQNYLKKK
jgi:hypothetical protein